MSWILFSNISSGINFKLFHASELIIVEIFLQESILMYLMHLRWILVKYVYRNQFLTYFMHLNWIFLKYAFTSRFGAILCIWAAYSWNMLPGIDLELFYTPELNIAEIFFQESILNYFMHLHFGSAGTVYRASNNQGPHRYGITKSPTESTEQPPTKVPTDMRSKSLTE